MSDAIRKLEDVRMTDVAEVGGKAAGLGELLAAGARVPDGVVLTVGGAHLPADERGSLLGTQIAGLGDGPFAVRSSAVGEDSAERSYAGMYESVLNVSAADLGEAMEETLASRRGTRVAGYEVSGGGANGEIAVIVQRMISAVAAGVALTADPITGDRQTCVVTAVRGIGDRLVSGAALGDEWAVVNGTATARRQPEHAISGPQAEEVATEARRIADLRGAPQDIEWAVDAEGTL
ncbi:MAG: PEP/pyruvate-binding domain-containing protein, partial [Chloroflexota bacterium]